MHFGIRLNMSPDSFPSRVFSSSRYTHYSSSSKPAFGYFSHAKKEWIDKDRPEYLFTVFQEYDRVSNVLQIERRMSVV